jgi:hypothetical protein
VVRRLSVIGGGLEEVDDDEELSVDVGQEKGCTFTFLGGVIGTTALGTGRLVGTGAIADTEADSFPCWWWCVFSFLPWPCSLFLLSSLPSSRARAHAAAAARIATRM